MSGTNIPVIAAGGILDARGYVAALALGAHGVCLGTSSVESYAHPLYNMKLVKLDKTEYTDVFGRQKDIRRFAGTVPNATATGDVERMAMYAAQGVGLSS
ncbi:nitronate monooxygenase [Tripterygium wilfordii]|uniref:Nitronate monooxygenase n=1 Tax=Tripterygium wilfordii TaxID=458696 RepID=A0A7J7CH11_TRIWF|nr:nitronate monooxygenase [Tripterygium wilfordii]